VPSATPLVVVPDPEELDEPEFALEPAEFALEPDALAEALAEADGVAPELEVED
jgi:hypothetical protein